MHENDLSESLMNRATNVRIELTNINDRLIK